MLVVAGSAQTFAQDAPPKTVDEDLALEVRKVVRRLNDEELARRDAAERALIEMGPAALAHLPAADDRMPAEMKHRLARVRQKLERAEAESAVEATKITLSGKGLPLADIFAKIEAQTGNKLVDFRDRFGGVAAPVSIDVELKDEPFWPALDTILDTGKLAAYHFSGERTLAVTPREEGAVDRRANASYAGVFRFEAIRVEADRDLRNPSQQSLSVQLEVAWEPRLLPIALAQPLDKIHAVGPDGEVIAVVSPDAQLEVPVQEGTTAVEMQIPFKLPPRSVVKIARLTGEVQAIVPGRIEKFAFEKLSTLNKVEQRRGGVVVAVDTVRQVNDELCEVRMRVTFDEASGALESHRGWIFKNPCYLVGEDEKPIDNAGFETTRQTENEVGLAFFFEIPDAKGYTFVYETPAGIVSLPVKYELKDIELP